MNKFVEAKDMIGMTAIKNQIEKLSKLHNTVGVKTATIKSMWEDCIKTLRSIRNVDRTAYDNRINVIALRELLRRLMVVCDDTQLKIRN